MDGRRLIFLVHKGKDYTLRHYFASWGAVVRDRVGIRIYPGVGNTGCTFSKRLTRQLRTWRTGTLRADGRSAERRLYVFADLETLALKEAEAVAGLWRRLAASPATERSLNNPSVSLRRFELLTALRNAGFNSFDAYRAEGDPQPGRWPVFTREDRSHDDDSISELLDSPRELSSHLAATVDRGGDLRKRIVVEYAGAPSEDGLFRKYGAIRLSDSIIPCHIFFSHQWMVKHSAVFNTTTAREELEYIEANPHREELERAFEIAGIEYGRADYSLIDDNVQIWEINTNPYLIRPQYTRQQARQEVLRAFSDRFNDAVRELLDR